ncbi:MAG TPA: hypothetical protein VHS36_05990 [Candidatus Limnocylindrales bacterium]|nr:hypothetical protein [Candidatus Limnocylindrales bacterium]
MTGPLAAAFVVGATLAAFGLVLPAARRTGLGPWHPAVAWLALELVFFGIGSAVLAAVDGRLEPALDVGCAVLLFAAGVAASNRLAAARAARDPSAPAPTDTAGAPIRPLVVVALAAAGVAALIPTLVTVGIPFLANDITGARSEVGGLDLQVLRVTLPAAVLVAVIVAIRSEARRDRLIAMSAFLVAVGAEIALASRYLAAELLAAVVVALAIARRPLPLRGLAAIGVVAALLFVSVGILRAYDQAAGRELDFAVERTVNRVLLIQPRTLDALQTAIPAEQPFFDGLTWVRRFAPLVGRNDVPNLGYWIYPRLFPDQLTPGYAAPGLLGEAWANFGWLGLGLFALLGLLVERLGALVARRRRETADIVTGALATLFIARTHALGVNGAAILLGILVLWRLLAAPIGGLARDLRATAAWRT